MRFFRKELPRNSFLFSDGTKAEFEAQANSLGLICIDESKHPQRVADLEGAIKRNVGGISEISEVQFLDLKKKLESVKPQPPKPVSAIREANFQSRASQFSAIQTAAQPVPDVAAQVAPSVEPAVDAAPTATAPAEPSRRPWKPRVSKTAHD